MTLSTPLHDRLDVVAPGLTRRDALQEPLGDHVVDGVERQVRVDGRRAEADEQRHVVHLAGVAGLDDEPDLRPRLLAHEVVVDRRGEQQGGNGRPVGRGVAVGEDDHVGALRDGGRDPAPHLVDGAAQRLAPRLGGRAGPAGLADVEQPVDGEGLEARRLAVLVDVHELGQVVAVDHRQRQEDLAARPAARASSRFASGPIVAASDVTSSSRMASSGGFVTWANSWVK